MLAIFEQYVKLQVIKIFIKIVVALFFRNVLIELYLQSNDKQFYILMTNWEIF